ncbi:TPA: hypothetical protein ON622_003025 [Morganella morganii]|nr:hypothetical protein [Morganella morganii]
MIDLNDVSTLERIAVIARIAAGSSCTVRERSILLMLVVELAESGYQDNLENIRKYDTKLTIQNTDESFVTN